MRKIAVITGTRADYGIYRSVLAHLSADKKVDLSLIVVGMHLSPEFGCTIDEIKKDGYSVDLKIDILHSDDSRASMAESLGEVISKVSIGLTKLAPDILVVLGDRGEMLAGAVAATYLGIPVAHIHGGEVSGNVDDVVRHAITKLSHIHFPATDESAQRIIKMGEASWRVHVVGAPGLDSILNNSMPNGVEVANKYGLDLAKPLILMVQHSVVAEVKDAGNQIFETLEAVKELGYQTVIVYPNADAGGRSMIQMIKKYAGCPFIKAFVSLPREDYLGLMNIATVMIGNSSSGIIEAPSFGLPVINIGTRQMGRQRANNVIDVGYNKEQIIREVQKIIKQPNKHKVATKGLYGDGKAGQRIAKILSAIEIDEKLLEKRMAY
jgi:GDP/UDP-N,N'-diacetylbacillosamine 2-epimerase (hydrolysing)